MNIASKILSAPIFLNIVALLLGNSVALASSEKNPPQNSHQPLNDAIVHYNSRNYSVAEAELSNYLKTQPYDALAHYYLANIYVIQSQNKQAIQEYGLANRLTQDKRLQTMCLSAITSLNHSTFVYRFGANPPFLNSRIGGAPSKYIGVSRRSTPIRNSAPTTVIMSNAVPAIKGQYAAADTETSDPSLRKVFDTIQSQASNSSNQSFTQIENSSQALTPRDIQNKIDQLAINHTRNLNIIQRATEQPVGATRGESINLAEDRRSRTASEDRDYHQQLADLQTQLQQLNFQQQVRTLQDNIYTSHTHPNVGSAPQIDLNGTNLYTQNFLHPQRVETEPNELVATPERLLIDKHTQPGKTITRVEKVVPPHPEIEPNTKLKVKGQVIPR